MNISTEDKWIKVYVFENDGKISYSTGISNKNKDGSYSNMYIKLKFKKDDEPNFKDKFEMKINKAFLSFNEFNKNKYINIVVMEYEARAEEPEAPIEARQVDTNQYLDEVELTDDDLPF